MLPYVVLKGSGVAIGRGKEALWAVANSNSIAAGPTAPSTTNNSSAGAAGGSAGGGGGSPRAAGASGASPPAQTPTCIASPLSLLAMGSDRRLSEALSRNLGFVEVADGRVSRLHCIIRRAWPEGAEGAAVALLEDCSSNGTFHNGRRMGRGETGAWVDGHL